MKDGIVEKNCTFCQEDNYYFNVILLKNIKDNKITFEYDINHPLYLAFFHLLKDDSTLRIEDDGTKEYDKKYLEISKNNDSINLTFVNNLENDKAWSKFNVFVKNTDYDLKSKIDRDELDTKERLKTFFNEVKEDLQLDYHQITMDEYVLKKKLK